MSSLLALWARLPGLPSGAWESRTQELSLPALNHFPCSLPGMPLGRASRAFLDSFSPEDVLENLGHLLVDQPKLSCYRRAAPSSRLSQCPPWLYPLTKGRRPLLPRAQPVDSLSGKKVAQLRGTAPRRWGSSISLCGPRLPLCSSPALKRTSTASRSPGLGYGAARACPGHAPMLSLPKEARKERCRQGPKWGLP